MTEQNGVERSTATETLRAMLDERGVEWKAPASYDGSTKYDTIVNCYWFHEYNGKITVHGLTPEQAIAATLGVSDATRERQGVASFNCTNSERMSDELLPCPFCGGVPIVDCGYHYDYDGGDRWYVYSADVVCNCGCTLHVDNAWPKEYVSEEHSLDFAIAAWNRRTES